MATLNYNKIATILLREHEPITLVKLSVISGMPILETKEILSFFASEGFLKYGNNYDKIQLSDKARSII